MPLIKAAIAHNGLAFIDVISPCVTFNNVPTSTKSYHWVREHMEATNPLTLCPCSRRSPPSIHTARPLPCRLHDGSIINLYKREDKEIITSRRDAIAALEKTKENEQILTGILYLDPDSQGTHEILGTTETPLNTLGEKELCPGNELLQAFNESLR